MALSSLCQHVLAHTHTGRNIAEEARARSKWLIRAVNVCEDLPSNHRFFHRRLQITDRSALYSPFSNIFLNCPLQLHILVEVMPYHVSLVFRPSRHLPCSAVHDKDGNQILCFQRITGTSFSKNSSKPSSNTHRKSGVIPTYSWKQGIHINAHTVCFCPSCGLYDVLGLHNLCQVSILIHLADATSYTTISDGVLMRTKTCHTGLTVVHK